MSTRIGLAAAAVIVVAAATPSSTGANAAWTPAIECSIAGTQRPPPNQLTRYTLSVHVEKGLRAVTGTLAVRFAPEVATDRIVFRLWPNEPFLAQKGAKLTVRAVRSNGKTVPTARPNATTLVVRRQLSAGESTNVSMKWRLRLPSGSQDRLYGGSLARLGSFFPLLAWDPRRGWQTDPPSTIGWETWTSPSADFDVRVTAPRGLRVLASGERVGSGHWRAHALRDFALAVGRFTVVTGTATAPNPVRLTVGVQGRGAAFANALLADATAALEAHAQRFGPYPWPTVTVVASNMGRFAWEYPTIVFVSANTPDRAGGVAHELGHQWFYSLVGNNQARDPWLDETLATWAQVRFSNTLADELALTIPDSVSHKLGEPMSFWDGFLIPEFILGAYDQGVQALASLGAPDDVDCALRLYVQDNAYGIAVPSDLLSALQTFFSDAREKLEAFGARF